MTTKRLQRRGFNIILSAASGVGKSTIIKNLIKEDDDLQYSISATTRSPRGKEIEGKNYHFKTKKEFYQLMSENAFLEYAEVFGNFYGTLKSEVEAKLQKGKDVIFDLDWQGTSKVIKRMPKDTISVFILPPSMKELERRITSRNQDEKEVIFARMARAKSEMSHCDEYDYVIINDDFDSALIEIRAIIQAHRLKRNRFINIEDFIEAL